MQKEINKFLKKIHAEKLKNNDKECIELYNIVGGMCSEIGSYDEAIHYHEEALSLCKKLGDRLGTAVAFRYIGEAQAAVGSFYSAIESTTKYLDLADKIGNQVEIQRALTTLGRVYLMQAQDLKDKSDVVDSRIKEVARKAEKRFQEALNLAESIREKVDAKEYAQMTSGLLINLGLVKDICGQHSETVVKLRRAIEICKSSRLKEDLYRAQVILAGIFRQQDDLKMAAKTSEEALQTAKSIGKKILICDALIERGFVKICQRDFKNAKRTFAQAYLEKSPSEEDHTKAIRLTKLTQLVAVAFEKVCKDSTASETRLQLFDKLGDLFIAIGNYKLACEFYRRAYADAKICSKPSSEIARILYSIAETYADNGQFNYALAYFEKELACRNGNDSEQCQTLIKIAQMHEFLEHEPEKVCKSYEKALEKAGKAPKLMYNVLKFYVPYLEKKSFKISRKKELEEKLTNLKSYQEIIDYIESEDYGGEESNDLEDEIPNIDDIITDDEDNDEVLMIGRRRTKGANKFKKNEVGDTPLHEACIKGDFKRVKSLIEQGHEINPRDNAGWIPLHEACNHGHCEIAEYLLELGADVNNRGLRGMSPLHDAATNGHFAIVRMLIKHGANVISLTDRGETVLDCLRDYRKRNYSYMSNSEVSEYKQTEAELQHEMDRCGFNLMNENSKENKKREELQQQQPSTSATKEVQPKPRTFVSGLEKPVKKPVSDYKNVIGALKRKQTNMDNESPSEKRKSDQPAVFENNTGISTSAPTKQWLAGESITISSSSSEDEKEPEKLFSDDNVDIVEVGPTKNILESDNDDLFEDTPLQEMSCSGELEDLAEKEPEEISSPPAQVFVSEEPLKVTIEDMKLLIPVKNHTTIKELKASVVERFSVSEKATPIISLALENEPNFFLFDGDLCKDVIKNNNVIAKIDSWKLNSLEKTYIEECCSVQLKPIYNIKSELRSIDASGGKSLNFTFMRFPPEHATAVAKSLARRPFTTVQLIGSSVFFEGQSKAAEAILSSILTWNKLTCLELKCVGMIRSQFESICNGGSSGGDNAIQKAKFPELQNFDASYNCIAYKSKIEFASQLEKLRKTCPKLKRLDVRKNLLLFVKSIVCDSSAASSPPSTAASNSSSGAATSDDADVLNLSAALGLVSFDMEVLGANQNDYTVYSC